MKILKKLIKIKSIKINKIVKNNNPNKKYNKNK